MKGFFGIGVEGINKPRNLGNLVRSAHSFGASFFFAVAPTLEMRDIHHADTAKSAGQVPFYKYDKVSDMKLPHGCKVVGVEFIEDSVDLPSFCHPSSAVYILGPERGNLSDETLAICDHVVKIPMKFCINVGVAGALVMYDRLIHLGQFPARPVSPGGEPIPLPEHIQGGRIERTKKANNE